MKRRGTLADLDLAVAEFKPKGAAAPAPDAALPGRPAAAGQGGKRIQVGLRLDPDLYDRVRALSYNTREPIQGMLERLLLAELQRQEGEDG